MKWLLPVVFSLFVFIAGCNKQPEVPSTHRFEPFGEYVVEIEMVGVVNIAILTDETHRGNTHTKFAEYKWGENKLTFNCGELTFNDQECDPLNPGDHIRVDKDSKLFVNGKPYPNNATE